MRTRRNCHVYLPGLLLVALPVAIIFRQCVNFEEVFVGEMARKGAEQSTTSESARASTASRANGAPRATGVGSNQPVFKGVCGRACAGFGAGARYRVELRDVRRSASGPVDWLICVEVLEPPEIRRVPSCVRPPSAQVAPIHPTALNAPKRGSHISHRTAEDVKTQLLAAGFASSSTSARLPAPTHPIRWPRSAFIVK